MTQAVATMEPENPLDICIRLCNMHTYENTCDADGGPQGFPSGQRGGPTPRDQPFRIGREAINGGRGEKGTRKTTGSFFPALERQTAAGQSI